MTGAISSVGRAQRYRIATSGLHENPGAGGGSCYIIHVPRNAHFGSHKLSQRNLAALEHVDRGKLGAIITNRGESLWLGTSWLGGIFGARRHLLRCSRAYYRARSLLKSVHVQPPFSDGADGTSGRRSFQRLWNLWKRLRERRRRAVLSVS